MQAAKRITRQRSSTNDSHDENATAGVRVTRASNKAVGKEAGAGALQSKQATGLNRKRAMNDVTNVHKADKDLLIVEGKAGKKPAKSVLATKTGSGVTKATRVTTTRAIVQVKSEGLKRTNSSTLEISQPKTKKRNVSAASVVAQPDPSEDAENEPPVAIEKGVKLPEISDAETKGSVVDDQEDLEVRPKDFGWEDLDTEDREDPLMVSEYVNEIFEFLREKEVETQPNPDYMDHQDELQWKMRGILVDWLIEVHQRFRLLPETLFLAVNIIDRFLTNKVVSLDKLQLVGVTAMFIAAKYEEVFSPSVKNFIYVADGGYTEEEILKAERYILQSLDFNLSYPNPMNFLRRISKADNYDIQTRTYAKYLMEISLLDYRFMDYLPSHIAAASMYFARKMYNRGEWNANLVHYSGYSEEEVEPVFKLMIDYLARPVKHEAFFKKYASKKYLKSSIVCRTWSKANAVTYGVDITIPEDEAR